MNTCLDVVSFDLDGTLVDTGDEIADAVNGAFAAHGMPRLPPSVIKRQIGNGFGTLIRTLFAAACRDEPRLAARVNELELMATADQCYAETAGTTAVPYPGARSALVRLTSAGLRLVCVTNKESRHAHRVLAGSGLAPFFALTIGGDTLSQKKPHASVLQYVVKALHSDARRCAHVGDSATDVEAARNAGVTAWAVAYGYNGGVPIAEARPDRVFRDLGEMANFVLARRIAPAA